MTITDVTGAEYYYSKCWDISLDLGYFEKDIEITKQAPEYQKLQSVYCPLMT